MYECFSAFMSVYHVCAEQVKAKKKKRGASNPLDVELWMFVNCHVDAGNGTLVLCKGCKCS